jgi:hypothetical protein
MEFWSYPALYDENYFPPVESLLVSAKRNYARH